MGHTRYLSLKMAFPVFLGLFLSPYLRLFADNAPVTMAANIVNASPGATSVPVPVTVSGFTNIGKFSLTMIFDAARVQYVSATTNPALGGMTVTYTPPAGYVGGKLVLAWTGSSNASLPDDTEIATLTFSYTSGTGILSWYDIPGYESQYQRYDGASLVTLNDSPQYQFYLNGGISGRGAPVTTAPLLPVASAGAIAIPVTVTGFTGIAAMTLNLEYDTTVITYLNSFTKNAAFNSAFTVGNIPGTGSHKRITINWFGGALTLPGGSTLCTLNFTYPVAGPATTLSWFDNIESCEFVDGGGDVLIDLPRNLYYIDGGVAPPLTADFMADKLTPQKNETVTFTDLTSGNATSWVWSFDRPGVDFVEGTSASTQNPKVRFTESGPYSVTLAVSNTFFSDTEVKISYLRAGIPGRWTGDTSSDWNVATNWDNWLVPDSTTDVLIPEEAANWPVAAVLTLGVHCHNLTLGGTGSRLTVTGDLIIP